MAALVLGGGYFGIQTLLDKQSETKPIVIEIAGGKSDSTVDSKATAESHEKTIRNDPGSEKPRLNLSDLAPIRELPPAVAQRHDRSTKVSEPETADATLEQETPPTAKKSSEVDVETQHPAALVKGSEDATASSAPPSPAPERATKTWPVGNVHGLKAVLSKSIDGDRIELAAGQTFRIESAFPRIESKHLLLTSGGGRNRPVVRWALPKEDRITNGLFQIMKGGLTVEGVDFYVDLQNQNAADSELILFSLQQSDLHLVQSSVTVLNASRLPVTVVSLNGERPWDPAALGRPPTPLVVDIRDSIIRAARTTVAVDSRQARISIENSIACSTGSLIHVYHTRQMEFAHHKLTVDVSRSVLDIAGPVLTVDCLPYELTPVLVDAQLTSSLVLGAPSVGAPQVLWNTPVTTETVSSSIHWTGRENWYWQQGDGLMAKTAAGPVITLAASTDDWKRQSLGEETGWRVVTRLQMPRTPHAQRLPRDYSFARETGIEINRIAKPARRLPN